MSGYKEVLVAVDLSDDLTGALKAAVEKVATGANLGSVSQQPITGHKYKPTSGW